MVGWRGDDWTKGWCGWWCGEYGTLCVADVSLIGHLSADVVVFNLWLTRAARGLLAMARAIPSGYGTFQSKAFRPPEHGGDLLLAEKGPKLWISKVTMTTLVGLLRSLQLQAIFQTLPVSRTRLWIPKWLRNYKREITLNWRIEFIFSWCWIQWNDPYLY